MKEWTEAARAALEEYLAKVRSSLGASDIEPEEVLEDIRRHVDEEVRLLNSEDVTEEAVRGILRRMGPAVSPKDASPVVPPLVPVPKPGWGTRFILITLGVLIPGASILAELTTRMCAETFFDPLPSLWHILAAAFVPVANLVVLVSLGRAEKHSRRLGLLNAAAMGISIFYCLVFLSIVPLALIAVLVVIGILPLGPYCALISACLLRRWLRVQLGRSVPWFWTGALAGILVVPLLQVRTTVTRYGIARAASEDPQVAASGVRLLRKLGDEEIMLRACYERSGIGTDLVGFALGWKDTVTAEKGREIYFRVTGRLFNSVAPPKLAGTRRGDPTDRFEFDPDVGGESVAGRIRGLSLSASRIDGKIDPDAALAYVEWTLVFRNTSTLPQEARAEIATPPGGVVSRVTLWIDGEEREAAFGGRAPVRRAYESVVRRKRDPLLVTSRGPDRVLVQCFPVPPNGGEMKIRLGMTCPILLRARDQGHLRLPFFHETNFKTPADVLHSVWIESSSPLRPATGAMRVAGSVIRGEVNGSALANEDGVVIAARDPAVTSSWCADPNGGVVRGTLVEETLDRPNRVVIVVDGSSSMQEHVQKIAERVARLPLGMEFGVFVASDEVIDLTAGIKNATVESLKEISDRLARFEAEGGCDNVPALVKAWDLASERPGSLIVWIHGPHPLLFGKAEGLRQRLERQARDPVLLNLQVAPGPNTITAELDRIPALRSFPTLAGLARDFDHLLSEWSGDTKTLTWARQKELKENPADHRASDHLVRLWAFDRITQSLSSGHVQEAEKTAVEYRLVTPVSGAVVLETKEQYAAAGLEPVSPESVPTIPEPGEWLLFIIAVGVLLWAIRRKRVGLRAA